MPTRWKFASSGTTSMRTATGSTAVTTPPMTWAVSPRRPFARCSTSASAKPSAIASSRNTRTAKATSSPASFSRPTAATHCSTSAASRRCCPQAEQVQFERPEPGGRVKAYIVEVRKTAKGPQIVVSRTHPGLIKRLFELEVPEIADGVVEIKGCAREPGHRTKIAVWSNDANVDPVGACVGARGGRVRMVVNELRGEKIDIVPFREDLCRFHRQRLVAGQGHPGDRQRRRHAGRCHRARSAIVAGDRQGGAERPSRRPPDRRAHRYPWRKPADRTGRPRGLRRRRMGRKRRLAKWNGTVPMARWSAKISGPRAKPVKPIPAKPAQPTKRASRQATRPTRTGAKNLPITLSRAPQRTCVGCRSCRPQTELVRCALVDGHVVISRSASRARRMAVQRATFVRRQALKRRGFDKAFRPSRPHVESINNLQIAFEAITTNMRN